MAAFLVWLTPHTLILTNEEIKALGGPYHKYLGPLGLMPAKNSAVNIMILFTALSFMIYRRANRLPAVSWARQGNAIQAALFVAGIANILFLGVYHGYFTNTAYKVTSSIPQVWTTLIVILGAFLLEAQMYKGEAQQTPLKWGNMPPRAQYALILIATSYTWLMGLMGFARSAIRQHWHIYGVMRDNSSEAFTPSLPYAANVVSFGTILFMGLVIFVFWLSARDPEGVR